MRTIFARFNIVLLAAAFALLFTACPPEPKPDDDNKDDPPELPVALKNTKWKHIDALNSSIVNRVQFGEKNTVAVIPASGSSKTFTLKDSQTVSEINQTTLWFSDSQTADFIVYRDAVVNSVSLNGVQKTYGWQLDNGSGDITLPPGTLTDIESISQYLSTQSGGTTVGNPINLTISLQLTSDNWDAIVSAIDTSNKYVRLDLTYCTCSSTSSGNGLTSNGIFNWRKEYGNSDLSIRSRIVSFTPPSTATSIGDSTFRDCTSLTSVSFPKATSIDIFAFSGCTRLTSVSFPEVTEIGLGAFHSCTSLTSVSFPATTRIDHTAFSGCTGLTSVSFPEVTAIGLGAFHRCTSLTSVSFPEVTSIYANAFMDCTNLTSVNIPKVTEIGEYAFYGCTSLTSVSFPEVTSIDANAFTDCTSLTSVNIPEVIEIGRAAFYGCTRLTSITIGANVSIGEYNIGFDTAYNSGGKLAGTYTRTDTSSDIWTKQ